MKDEFFDKDYIENYLSKLDELTEKEIELTEKELADKIEIINNHLKTIEEDIKKAEEEGDENFFNMATIKKQLILQKLDELNRISLKIKKRR